MRGRKAPRGESKTYNRYAYRRFGRRLGYGLYVFVMGIVSLVSGRGRGIVALLSEWYVGFSPTILGSLIGAAWGFADGFLGGLLIAWIYNRLKKARK
jgi:hypothetical protein